LKRPFDLIAEKAMIDAQKKADGAISNGLSVNWLPFLDTYRTMCITPASDFRRLLEGVRDLDFAA